MPTHPQMIGQYQIISQIKPGGQAMVYRARHAILQREVALKVLHAHLITEPDIDRMGARSFG